MSTEKKSLIHLDCRQFGSSGIGTYIENLISQYQKLDSDLQFKLLLKREHIKNLSSNPDFQLNEYNEPIYSIMEQFKWVSRVNPFGVLHVPHYNAPLLYPGKLIVTVHDVCHIAMRQYFPGLLKRLYSSLFFKRILVKAAHIITVSNFSKAEIMRYFDIDPEKISVIYNGVNSIYHPIEKEESDKVLERYRLPNEYILFLGNIKAHKNITGVLASYRKAVSMDNSLPPLVILGNNEKMKEEFCDINSILSDKLIHNKIIFTGILPTEALPSIYSRALIFLFPSFYEGFGLTSLEAMACGTPVITSNVSAIPEVVDNAALLVNPHDNEQIASSILRLAADSELQRDYIQRGFDQVKKYSWEKSAESHLQIFRKVAETTTFRSKPPKIVPPTFLVEKQNILFLDQYGDRVGGGQVILLDILEKFRSSGLWNVYVSLPEEGNFTQLLSERGFPYHIIKTWQPTWHHEIHFFDYFNYTLSSIKSSYYIGRLIKKNGIKVVYCNGGRTFLNGAFLSTLFSLKLFFHLHLLLEEKQKKAVTILGRAPGVKSIFAVSKLLEHQYLKHSIYRKMCVVSNWVSPELLSTQLITRKAQIALPIRIGIVGQISKAKGQWTVLTTLLESEAILPIKLLIFGDHLIHEPEHWQEVLDLIDGLNRSGWDVEYRGFVNKKTQIYDNIDVLVIPSLVSESFGLTAIEAMVREVIVIANRSGALVETIKHGENGLLYDATEMSQLLTILHTLVRNEIDCEKLRREGLKTVHSNYHPEKQLELLHKTVYEAAIQ
ncbi:glycosyltransferase [bacterium]|nr:glycosyltransferase [bacterium]